MEIELFRTNSDDPGFRSLVALLDAELAERDGAEHEFFARFNKIDSIRNVVVARWNGTAVGCGAFKPFDSETAEIKRMFVMPDQRGRRIAAVILDELETWAAELGFVAALLETGYGQPEAIRLYERSGYARIPNFGQYSGVASSVCFSKRFSDGRSEMRNRD
jgi:GNAT superfamily N-acetyltransferase